MDLEVRLVLLALALHNHAYDFTVVYLSNQFGNGFGEFLGPLMVPENQVWGMSVLGQLFPCVCTQFGCPLRLEVALGVVEITLESTKPPELRDIDVEVETILQPKIPDKYSWLKIADIPSRIMRRVRGCPS